MVYGRSLPVLGTGGPCLALPMYGGGWGWLVGRGRGEFAAFLSRLLCACQRWAVVPILLPVCLSVVLRNSGCMAALAWVVAVVAPPLPPLAVCPVLVLSCGCPPASGWLCFEWRGQCLTCAGCMRSVRCSQAAFLGCCVALRSGGWCVAAGGVRVAVGVGSEVGRGDCVAGARLRYTLAFPQGSVPEVRGLRLSAERHERLASKRELTGA